MEHEDKSTEKEHPQVMAERSMPSATKKSNPLGQKAILIIGAIAVMILLIAVNGGFSSEKTKEKDSFEEEKRNKIANHLGKAPEMPLLPKKLEVIEETPPQEEILHTSQVTPPPPAPVYKETSYRNQNHKNKEQTPEERKMSSPILGYSSKGQSKGGKGESVEADEHGSFGGEEKDSFGGSLRPTALAGAKASMIPDRNLFITKGTFIDCVLETAISSDVLGMISCRMTRDVYSTSGKIVLLERGTRIVGQYKGGVQHGKSRIFALWNRAETPNGVIIDLDSGGTDALGRAGHEGFIDSHFAERFSSAIMLSFIDDIGAYAVNQASNNQNEQIQFNATAGSASDAAGIALENSINIRPTFYKNQGDHINIFVVRDLDFRDVYELKSNY